MDFFETFPDSKISPKKFYAFVEISKGSNCKYEIDHESGLLILDRVLFTATHYPQNYGFIPRTLSEDGDPLDVLIIMSEPMVPLSLTEATPIGVLEMVDNGALDEKIIAVCCHDPDYKDIKDISELPQHLADEIRHFFSVYKQLEIGKTTVVKEIAGHEKAEACIAKCIQRFKDSK